MTACICSLTEWAVPVDAEWGICSSSPPRNPHKRQHNNFKGPMRRLGIAAHLPRVAFTWRQRYLSMFVLALVRKCSSALSVTLSVKMLCGRSRLGHAKKSETFDKEIAMLRNSYHVQIQVAVWPKCFSGSRYPELD